MDNAGIGMVIWVGEDRFVKYQVDLQDRGIQSTFNDVRGILQLSSPMVVYALEFTVGYKVYTAYRHVTDLQARDGILAVTLFLPYSVKVRDMTSLLEKLSVKYYRDHYGLGGILKTDTPVYEEIYIKELNRLLQTEHPVIKETDEWTGVPSTPEGQPKILPYTDIRVVEHFYQTPQRPPFYRVPEVIFVPATALDGTTDGLKLPDSLERFSIDGQDIGDEVVGVPLDIHPAGVVLSDLTLDGRPVTGPVYVRDGSRLTFRLKNGRFYDDICFEGPVREAVGLYLDKTPDGFRFKPILPFRKKKVSVQLSVACCADGTDPFIFRAVSRERTFPFKEKTVYGGSTDFCFEGEEMAFPWDIVVVEHGYEYLLFPDFCPERHSGFLEDRRSRLISIRNRSGREILIENLPSLRRTERNVPVDGAWILPPEIQDSCFSFSYDSDHFMRKISGWETGEVVIALERTCYDLCIAKGVWKAFDEMQRRSLSFAFEDEYISPEPDGFMKRVSVQSSGNLGQGRLTTRVFVKDFDYRYSVAKDEEKSRLTLKPDVVQIRLDQETPVTLTDGTSLLLPAGSFLLPSGAVSAGTMERDGFKVARVGGEAPDEPSFHQFSKTSDGGRAPETAGHREVLGNLDRFHTEDPGRGEVTVGYWFGGVRGTCKGIPDEKGFLITEEGFRLAYPVNPEKTQACERNVGYSFSLRGGEYLVEKTVTGGTEPPRHNKWLLYALIALGLLLLALAAFLLFFKKGTARKDEVKVEYRIDSRPDADFWINPMGGKKGIRIPDKHSKIMLVDTSEVQGPIEVTLVFNNEGGLCDLPGISVSGDTVISVLSPAMVRLDSLRSMLCHRDTTGLADSLRLFRTKYPSDYVHTVVTQIEKEIAQVEAMERLIQRVTSMDCKKSSVDSLSLFLSDSTLWMMSRYVIPDRKKETVEGLWKAQSDFFKNTVDSLQTKYYVRKMVKRKRRLVFNDDYIKYFGKEQRDLMTMFVIDRHIMPEGRDSLSYRQLMDQPEQRPITVGAEAPGPSEVSNIRSDESDDTERGNH